MLLLSLKSKHVKGSIKSTRPNQTLYLKSPEPRHIENNPNNQVDIVTHTVTYRQRLMRIRTKVFMIRALNAILAMTALAYKHKG
jgi:hypothetical protein